MEVCLMNTINKVLIFITVVYFQKVAGKGQYEEESKQIPVLILVQLVQENTRNLKAKLSDTIFRFAKSPAQALDKNKYMFDNYIQNSRYS